MMSSRNGKSPASVAPLGMVFVAAVFLSLCSCEQPPQPPPRTLNLRTGPAGLIVRVEASVTGTPGQEDFGGVAATIQGGEDGAKSVVLPPVRFQPARSRPASPPSGIVCPLERRAVLALVVSPGQWRLWRNGKTGTDLSGTAPAAVRTVKLRLQAGRGIRVRVLSRQKLDTISFEDHFTSHDPPQAWTVVSGEWQIKGMTFSEHSLNPFCLAAGVPRDRPAPWRTEEDELGLGMRLGFSHVTPLVVRISGDSPASRAGIEVGDEVLEVNARRIGRGIDMTNFDTLFRPFGQPNVVKIRKRFGGRATVNLTREHRRWGGAQRLVDLPASTRRMSSLGEPVNLVRTGWGFWRDYTVAAACKVGLYGGVGLAVYGTAPDSYFAFRWLGETADPAGCNRMEIVQVVSGRARVLASAPGGPLPGQWYRLRLTVRGQEIEAGVDGHTVLKASSDALCAGWAGCYSLGRDEALFDDVSIASHGPTDTIEADRVPFALRNDPKMRHWASHVDEWRFDQKHGVWWNRLPWPPDVRVEWLRMTGSGTTFYLGCTGEDPKSGYRLRIDPFLARVGVSQARRGFEASHELVSAVPAARGAEQTGPVFGGAVSVQQKGRTLTVEVAGKKPCVFELPAPFAGDRLGVAGGVLRGDFQQIRVASSGVVNEFFTDAPVGWLDLGGRWGSVNRWICDPRWSYHGGVGDDLIAMTSKDAFEGDVQFDGFLAPMMVSATPPFERFWDIYLSLFADPLQPASGYTIAYRPGGRRTVELYRNGKRIGVSMDDRLFFPPSTFADQWVHRTWQHFSFRREGRTVTFQLDDAVCFRFEDPEPIPSGHVTVWSVDNGLLVARLRLAFDRRRSLPVFKKTWRPFYDWRLTNLVGDRVTALVDRAGAAAGEGEYTVRNLIGGGPFSVAFRPTLFNVARRPRLTFEFRAERGVKVDLYFDAGPKRFRVILTGPETPVDGVVTLARAPGVEADGKWHAVRLDFQSLLAAYRDRIPCDYIRGLSIGNHANPHMLLGGDGGNHRSAAWFIRKIDFPAGGSSVATRPSDPGAIRQ